MIRRVAVEDEWLMNVLAANDGHITQPVPQLVKDNIAEIEEFAKVRD